MFSREVHIQHPNVVFNEGRDRQNGWDQGPYTSKPNIPANPQQIIHQECISTRVLPCTFSRVDLSSDTNRNLWYEPEDKRIRKFLLIPSQVSTEAFVVHSRPTMRVESRTYGSTRPS
ncbi:hypothetical protein JTB14_002749 [Gonioctena quinquepunctata]|nr:hypothetical protein JTB14_002749 [Gonioctena quinquepunctata]